MSTDWAGVENVLRAWVLQGSGLAAGQVYFAHQNGKVPAGTCIAIALGDPRVVGQDSAISITDLSRTAGTEIEFRTAGVREFPVMLQAFTSETAGNSTARAVLSRVQAALALPTVRDALNAAGISVFDAGMVKVLNAVDTARFEGRAVLDVRCYANESVSEFTGYIASVEEQDLDTGRTYILTST